MVRAPWKKRDTKLHFKASGHNQNTASLQTEAVVNTALLDMFKDADITISSSAHSCSKEERSSTVL